MAETTNDTESASGTELYQTKDFDPAKFKLGESLSSRLSLVSGISGEALKGRAIADVAGRHAFRIDPMLLFFREVCGRVVKTDPATGIDYPVPFATVQVEDTDCSLLGYFPSGSPWAWYFPFSCKREVIATTQTDECGNFCVYVPRWDIDWVLRFRRMRRCYAMIFDRPSIKDLFDRLHPVDPPVDIQWPPNPIPEPIPTPFRLDQIDRALLRDRASEAFGSDVAQRFDQLVAHIPFGGSLAEAEALLAAPAPLTNLRPTLPAELRMLTDASTPPEKRGEAADKKLHQATLAALGARAGLDPEHIANVDLRRYIGPFLRCHDVFVPEWMPVFDIPDITFRVLQDTDGDGVEEVIYGEGHFDVRWDAGAMPDQTIHAWPNARAGNICGPTSVPCGNAPAIILAGRLPVTGDPAVFDGTPGDPAAGYAMRTNRPRSGGSFAGAPIYPGRSPLRDTLALYGCNRTDSSATHYRVMYRYRPDGGTSFTAPTPFTGLTWPLYRLNSGGIGEWHYPAADSQGWYPIDLPDGPNPWLPQALLLDWPTFRRESFPNGLYQLVLELGTGGVASSASAEVSIMVDNSRPVAPISVEYAFAAGGPYTPIGGVCPVVRRGAVPRDVYFRVRVGAAARHLQSTLLSANGCGAGNFMFVSGSGGELDGSTRYRRWHSDPNDNAHTLEAIFLLPAATAAQGTYSFAARAVSRAFNPSGGDAGHLATPSWQYDPVHSWINPSIGFSVFDAD